MTDPKVVVDTNVLIAASILFNIAELGTVIKHEFYDQSIQLFSLFRKFSSKRIGYLVPTVKYESRSVLAKAVKSVFVPRGLENPDRRDLFYRDAFTLVSASEQRMRGLMKLLNQEKLDQQRVKENNQKVKKMYKYLKGLWDEKYGNKEWRKRESRDRSESIMKEKHWKDEQKMEVVSAYREQVNRESDQLYRFKSKYPNSHDGLILAQTITLKEKLDPEGRKYDFMIASCDSGTFSPYVGRNGVSDIVTRETLARFHVYCNYPRRIYYRAGGI